MSLKAFHVVFISLAILLTFGLAAWSVMNFLEGRQVADLAYGIGSAVGGVCLILYGRYVLKKLKHISYL